MPVLEVGKLEYCGNVARYGNAPQSVLYEAHASLACMPFLLEAAAISYQPPLNQPCAGGTTKTLDGPKSLAQISHAAQATGGSWESEYHGTTTSSIHSRLSRYPVPYPRIPSILLEVLLMSTPMTENQPPPLATRDVFGRLFGVTV